MLAKLADALPKDQSRWAFEYKWDGFRALAYLHLGSFRMVSRNQLDFGARFPEFAGLATTLADSSVLLDGEIVAFNDAGQVSFEALQQRTGMDPHKRQPLRPDVSVAYMIFDILHMDGQSLLDLPYTQRRQRLAQLPLNGPAWMLTGSVEQDGTALFEESKRNAIEGIVAKRLDSTYEPGKRTGAWLKVKNHGRQEFVIGGWVPGEGRRSGAIGALVIGYYENGALISAGRVGTGFTDRMLADLDGLLGPLRQQESPFGGGEVPRATRFVAPSLVCEVEFTEWTSTTGQLRHPSFKGLRPDKSPREVLRERPTN